MTAMAPTAPTMINVLVSSFAGLALPKTLSLPIAADTTISSFSALLSERLPSNTTGLLLSTPSRRVDPTSDAPISTLLETSNADFLSLHLRHRLCGGKGGFGSQLRAAGGKMSSRKNKNRSQAEINGSNRNLDGRRLRTITEAKNLAEYLAMKPDMDKKEREERRKRWEAVVEAAERKEDEMKRGKGNVRLDGEWVEAKEEAENKTREAVIAAMKAAETDSPMLERTGSESSASGEEQDSDAQAEGSASGSSDEDKAVRPAPATAATRTFYGWDEDDDFMSDDDEDEVDEEGAAPAAYEGKGKAKA